MNRWLVLVTVCAAGARVLGEGVARSPQAAAAPVRVVVSILPQVDFVERVGGGLVTVDVLVGAGQSPHTYEPTPRQLESLARARIYFTIGIDFETALVPRIRAQFPQLTIIDTGAGVPRRYLSADELDAEARHEHASAGPPPAGAAQTGPATQASGRPDPHIWLNPLYVKIQAETICQALSAADPAHADQYRANLSAFDADLDRIHKQLAEVLAPLRGRDIFVFHPAFGYFTDAYGLRQIPVEIEGKEPSARQLAALIGRARGEGVKVIFVQPQFATRSAEAVAQAIGGAVVPMDDLPRHYLKNLEDMADKIRAALRAAKVER